MSESGEGVVNVQISVDQSEIDAAIASIDTSTLGKGVKGSDSVKSPKQVASEIKGLETTVHRLARMIPGVREIDRTYRNVGKFQAGYVGIAIINFALIAARVIRMINQYYEQKKRQEQEMEAAIREVRNITTHESYMQWKTGQRTEMNSARTRNISM